MYVTYIFQSFHMSFLMIFTKSLWGQGFPGGSESKESACNVGDLGWIPGLGRSPGEGNGYQLQYSGLENPMDCTVHGVAKSWTRLSDFHFTVPLGQHSAYSTLLHNFLPRITNSYLDNHNWVHCTCLLPFFCDHSRTWLCSLLCYWQIQQILME